MRDSPFVKKMETPSYKNIYSLSTIDYIVGKSKQKKTPQILSGCTLHLGYHFKFDLCKLSTMEKLLTVVPIKAKKEEIKLRNS